jgi:hypothetical protein
MIINKFDKIELTTNFVAFSSLGILNYVALKELKQSFRPHKRLKKETTEQ